MRISFLAAPAFLFMAIGATAQTNNLIIFDQQGETFYAIINGIQQNATPQTNVKITGLNSNTCKATIIFKDSTIHPVDKNIFFENMGTEETADIIIKKNGEHVLRFVSAVPLPPPAPPAPNQNVVAYNTTPPPPPPPPPAPPTPPVSSTTTVVRQTTTTTDAPVGTNLTLSVNGMGVGMNVAGITQSTTTTTTTTTDGGITQSTVNQPPPPVQNTPPPPPPSYVPGYNGPIGCPMPMTHNDYESAKNSISQKDFENTKLDMAKQIAGSNCMTAEQVRGIMKLFTFENSKLDFAKFAYSHTYDKGNYFKVNDAFEFDNSSTELSNYISGQQ